MNIFNTSQIRNRNNLGDRGADCLVNSIVYQLEMPQVLRAFTIA